jgi:hypothetical protein
MVTWIVIDEAQRDVYLGGLYNLPGADCSGDAFNEEWCHVFDKVREVVTKRWREGIGDGDFLMPDFFARDRSVCIEVANEEMLGSSLIQDVHDAIVEVEAEYVVDICDAWGMLRTKDGEDYPHFNVFVEKERVSVYAEDESTLRKLEYGVAVREISDSEDGTSSVRPDEGQNDRRTE